MKRRCASPRGVVVSWRLTARRPAGARRASRRTRGRERG
ncbi:hypothetical protein BMAPRL20_A1928 [Burkholderia mallei PRL-20]|nr:hypothetical protein BMAFMH_0085 [Burkholderia mallei FMH]EDK58440.1 hypothetical protein BMAJHU_0084 [Burkholderia mallei JHU]EES45425.1 hypothetical protein BMAPRL20_A1928 [Burkholderia mallei PRL-20]